MGCIHSTERRVEWSGRLKACMHVYRWEALQERGKNKKKAQSKTHIHKESKTKGEEKNGRRWGAGTKKNNIME